MTSSELSQAHLVPGVRIRTTSEVFGGESLAKTFHSHQTESALSVALQPGAGESGTVDACGQADSARLRLRTIFGKTTLRGRGRTPDTVDYLFRHSVLGEPRLHGGESFRIWGRCIHAMVEASRCTNYQRGSR